MLGATRTWWRRFAPWIVAIALVLGAALRPAWAQLADYRLGPGDRLQITVFGHQDLSSEANVSANGAIAMPLIGQIAAATLTVSELQGVIAQRLGDGYIVDPKISVEVIAYRPFFILGEVEKPGSYDYVAGINVRMAVAIAGGFSRRAKEEPVLLIREDKSGRPVRYRATLDTAVFPGDTIQVPRRLF